MSGVRSICVGRSGCGKTTLTKKMLNAAPVNMPKLIYDINNEYYDYYPNPFEDFDVFLNRLVGDEVRHHYIIIEEATIFFDSHMTAQEMKNVLVRARHTGNILQLNFHSFATVPKYIKNLLDYIIVFPTGDTLKDVKDKFDKPELIAAYEEVRIKSKSDPHFYKVVKMY